MFLMEPENKDCSMEVCEEEEVCYELTNQLSGRTPEQMEEIFKLANIPSSEVSTIIQTLCSTSSFNQKNDDYLVVEIDESIAKALTAGESLSFKGENNEHVVFCTNNKTYEVKMAETSNTCLIVPDLKCPDEVNIEGEEKKIIEKKEILLSYNKYYELKECRPRLSKLQVVLGPSSFKGLENEKLMDPQDMYDWKRLQSEIQASDEEIKEALADHLIAEMDGYYRFVSFEFEAKALVLMLDLIEENSWELDEVEKELSYESLQELIPRPIFEVLFKKYAEPTKTKEDGTQLYRYNEAKSCKMLAHVLLSAFPKNGYENFMNAWKEGVPEDMNPKEEYLYGIAIVRWDKKAARKEVVMFLESSLPDTLNKRLIALFDAKEKWTLQEITPYISSFTTKNQDVTAILTKFTRSSTLNGVRYYSAKHGK